MDNHSSLKKHQLTEDRSWPDGRHGCLFYIPERSYYITACGVIVLVNSENSDCHGYSNVIIEGFGAFIYASGYAGFHGEKEMDRYWTEYLELSRSAGIYPDELDTVSLLQRECTCWLRRNKLILNEFKDGYTGDLDHLFNYTLLSQIKTLSNSIEDLMWRMEPLVRIPHTQENEWRYVSYAQCSRGGLYRKHNEMDPPPDEGCCICEDEKIANGFTAFFINYIASVHLCNHFILTPDPDLVARKFAYGLDIAKGGTCTFADLEFVFDGLDCKQVYDGYIEHRQTRILRGLKRDSEFAIASEQTQKQKFFKILLEQELEYFDKNAPVHRYLSEQQSQILYRYTRDFLRYLMAPLDDLQETAHLRRQMENLFPELRKKQLTHPAPQRTDYSKPLLRSSFDGKLEDVYRKLVANNYLMPNQKDLFCKAMTFHLEPDERILWKGKIYQLAAFIDYAYALSPIAPWNAAVAWTCRGKNMTPEQLLNNKPAADDSKNEEDWKKLFKDI